MKIISFAWTTDALLKGLKTVTRRQWIDNYAKRFRKDDCVAAYDRSPRFGGRQVAVIRLTRDPYKEMLRDMPEEDVEREGGLWKDKAEFVELFGVPDDTEVWVVRFEVVEFLALDGKHVPNEGNSRSTCWPVTNGHGERVGL